MKKIISVLFTVGLLASFNSTMTEHGIHPILAVIVGIGIYFALAYSQTLRNPFDNIVRNDLQMEVWTPHIVKALFKNNDFLARAVNDSEYVNYKTVHKPQESDGVEWVKNRVWGAAPSNATDKTDLVLDYPIAEWTSELMRVLNIETLQLSYDKRASVLDTMLKKGKQTIADEMLYNWAATQSGNIMRTSGIQNNDISGGIVTTDFGHVNGVATGPRKVFGLYDMKKAFIFMSNQNVGLDGWVMVMTPNRYQELLDDILISKYRTSTPELNLKTGIVDRLMNFDIYLRTTTSTYTNAGTPGRKAVGAAAAVDDNDAIQFWSESAVCSAIGNNKLMYNPNQAAYGGDVMRGFIYMGGAKQYLSETGVGVIVQG